MTYHDLPAVEAAFNAVATILITLGFIQIRRGRREAHRNCMMSAAVASALFLACYLAYHGHQVAAHEGPARFGGHGFIRWVYFTILWTHIPLAALIAFLVPRTFILALQGRYAQHKAWARVTYPIWYYVSVTGVLVYLFVDVWWPYRA